jgi:hypothetical protein
LIVNKSFQVVNKKATVNGIFEIPNFKHQIPNKSQISNTKSSTEGLSIGDQNYLDFSSITEPEAFTAGLLFGILIIGICLPC